MRKSDEVNNEGINLKSATAYLLRNVLRPFAKSSSSVLFGTHSCDVCTKLYTPMLFEQVPLQLTLRNVEIF